MTDKAKIQLELLSPAGNMESLEAAVRSGADAVYFGGGGFNARRSAANFSETELLRAVAYCHLHGKKSYVTVNTLLFDGELYDALRFAEYLFSIGADAAIVQDLGLASLLSRELPEFELHASTQMGVHSLEGALMLKPLGFTRAVLSREVPLDMLKGIAGAGLELEIFAHGALCMGFSGGCLYSSMAGERSGNRGTCAQPCRKRISIHGMPGVDDYALSLSDICMIEHLSDMEAAGARCIKLEGRMKRPEYVAAVTRAYRLALDGEDCAEAIETTRAIFDRHSSTAYYFGDNAVTGQVAPPPDESALKRARAWYKDEIQDVPVDMTLTLHKGEIESLLLTARGKSAAVTGGIAQGADSPQREERYIEQLSKLGGTAFHAGRIEVGLNGCFMPASGLNALRREGVAALEAELTRVERERREVALTKVSPRERKPFMLLARVRNYEQARAAYSAGARDIALAPYSYGDIDHMRGLKFVRDGGRLLLCLPAVAIDKGERDIIRRALNCGCFDGAIAENIGDMALMDGLPIRIAGSRLNALNAHTVDALYSMGFDRVILSEELTKGELSDIISVVGGGIRVYGRTELMQLSHCPNKEYAGCASCKGDGFTPAAIMTDEAGRRFQLENVKQRRGCLVRLLNSAITDITDVYREIEPEFIELSFSFETAEETALAVGAALAPKDEKRTLNAAYTRGHWTRAVK